MEMLPQTTKITILIQQEILYFLKKTTTLHKFQPSLHTGCNTKEKTAVTERGKGSR